MTLLVDVVWGGGDSFNWFSDAGMICSYIFIDFEFFAGIVNKKYNVTVIEGIKAMGNGYRRYESDGRWL